MALLGPAVDDADRIAAARHAGKRLYDAIERLDQSSRYRETVTSGEELWDHFEDSQGGIRSERSTVR